MTLLGIHGWWIPLVYYLSDTAIKLKRHKKRSRPSFDQTTLLPAPLSALGQQYPKENYVGTYSLCSPTISPFQIVLWRSFDHKIIVQIGVQSMALTDYIDIRMKSKLWDPWPVKRCVPDSLFKAAQTIVKHRNLESADNYLDAITLLPARSNMLHDQITSEGSQLYSLRSPSVLPYRVQLWMTPRLQVMI